MFICRYADDTKNLKKIVNAINDQYKLQPTVNLSCPRVGSTRGTGRIDVFVDFSRSGQVHGVENSGSSAFGMHVCPAFPLYIRLLLPL